MPPSNLGQPDLYETLPGGPPPDASDLPLASASIRSGPRPQHTLPEGMASTPRQFWNSQESPMSSEIPNIQGGRGGPPPPPWDLSQEAGITPHRSLMGRPPVVSPHMYTPGVWTGDWQPPWQGSPQSPLPARVNQDRPWPESTYPGPALGQWRARGTAQPDEAGMQPRTELRDPLMSPIQMYLNTLSPSDKEAFLQRLASEEGRR